MSTRAHVIPGAVVAALLLAGCQGGEQPEPTGSPTPTSASTATPTGVTPTTEGPTTGTATTDEPTGDGTETDEPTGDATETDEPTGDATETDEPSSLPPWTSEMSEHPPGQAEEPQEITGVRTGLHEDYDRVVLDLTGDEPALGWFAGLVDETFEAGSGRAIEVEGERFLELGVNGIDWTNDSPERYDGETVQGQGTEVVTEVVFGVLFEGQQQIFVGLRQDTDYRVFALSDPARIVIDVRHPEDGR